MFWVLTKSDRTIIINLSIKCTVPTTAYSHFSVNHVHHIHNYYRINVSHHNEYYSLLILLII